MRNSALVVVDMLYDFIDGSLACANAENAVKATLGFIDSQTKGTIKYQPVVSLIYLCT